MRQRINNERKWGITMNKQAIIEGLCDQIDEKELMNQFKIRYYEELHKEERHETLVKKAFDAFDTLQEAIDKILSNEDFKIIKHRVEEIKFNLEDIIISRFNQLEELFMNAQSEKIDLSEIEKDEHFFDEYDAYKEDMRSALFNLNPKKMYEEGKNLLGTGEKSTILTEQELMYNMVKSTDISHVLGILGKEFGKIIDEGKKYELVIDEEIGGYEHGDGVLMDRGKFDLDEYLDIYPFMYEYTGRRVSHLAMEGEQGEDFSYWATYEEHFRNLLTTIIMDRFEQVLIEFNSSKQSEYDSLMKQLYISPKDVYDVQKILKQSPFLYDELNEFQEEIWFKFTSSNAREIYDNTKKGSK